MRKLFSLIAVLAAAVFQISARDYSVVDFDKEIGYRSVGIYDTWEQSPFRDGRLKGNYAIVATDGLHTTPGYDTPSRVLGAQRSRYGSNTFGAKIELTDTFTLSSDLKYVHVIMYRPVDGRVMLVGIGGSSYFPTNGNQVEQFWEMSMNPVRPDQWVDAVFAVKGFQNSSVNTLVVIPECESPHTRAEDFPFYIASIVVNDSPRPLINYENYMIKAGSRKDSITLDPDSSAGYLDAINIVSGTGSQTIGISQGKDRNLYREILDRCVTALPGDKISVSVDHSHPDKADAYVYVDWDQNGVFEYLLNDNGSPADNSEIMSYSYATNRNSLGHLINSRPDSMSLPTFIVPENIKPGVYRMRVKIDNDNIDPSGSDHITHTGGSITDLMLNIHSADIAVNDNQLNGEVLAADGSKLNSFPSRLGHDFPVKIAPERGFRSEGLTVRYGHLSGDSVIMENPQYFQKDFRFKDKDFTIPGKYMLGDVLLMGRMIEE